jgi:hypothetical protein
LLFESVENSLKEKKNKERETLFGVGAEVRAGNEVLRRTLSPELAESELPSSVGMASAFRAGFIFLNRTINQLQFSIL